MGGRLVCNLCKSDKKYLGGRGFWGEEAAICRKMAPSTEPRGILWLIYLGAGILWGWITR